MRIPGQQDAALAADSTSLSPTPSLTPSSSLTPSLTPSSPLPPSPSPSPAATAARVASPARAAPVPDALVGRTIGAYRVVAELGEGAMGKVYVGEHQMLGRRVAIKVLQPAFAADEDSVSRFFDEARVVTAIHHPNIVDVIDFGDFEGRSYFVMELLEGETLGDRLASVGRLDPDVAVKICGQIAAALASAHDRGIVHRDLKPDNTFLCSYPDYPDHVKVLDFGVAKLVAEGEGREKRRTRVGTVLGTPLYMSPEQCLGSASLDHRSDIYALGVMLYEMVTGISPFDRGQVTQVLMAHLNDAPVPPRQHRPDLPEALEKVILRTLEKAPSDRYDDMRQLRAAMGAASSAGRLQTAPIVAPETGASAPARSLHAKSPMVGDATVPLPAAEAVLSVPPQPTSTAAPRDASPTERAMSPASVPEAVGPARVVNAPKPVSAAPVVSAPKPVSAAKPATARTPAGTPKLTSAPTKTASAPPPVSSATPPMANSVLDASILPEAREASAARDPKRIRDLLVGIILERIRTNRLVLPGIPVAALTALRELNKPDINIGRVAKVLSDDPLLAPQLLWMSSSAAYGGGRAPRTIEQAVVRLGVRRLRTVLYELAARSVFDSPRSRIRDAFRGLWDHSVTVAGVAKRVCNELKDPIDPDIVHLAGLLHDAGKPVVAALLLEAEKVLAHEGNWLEEDAWMEVITSSHREVGSALAAKWQMAPEIRQVITGCERYGEGPDAIASNIVCFANAVAKHAGKAVGPVNTDLVDQQLADGTEKLALDWRFVHTLVEHVGDLERLYAPAATPAPATPPGRRR